jgi:hypothetical protein
LREGVSIQQKIIKEVRASYHQGVTKFGSQATSQGSYAILGKKLNRIALNTTRLYETLNQVQSFIKQNIWVIDKTTELIKNSKQEIDSLTNQLGQQLTSKQSSEIKHRIADLNAQITQATKERTVAQDNLYYSNAYSKRDLISGNLIELAGITSRIGNNKAQLTKFTQELATASIESTNQRTELENGVAAETARLGKGEATYNTILLKLGVSNPQQTASAQTNKNGGEEYFKLKLQLDNIAKERETVSTYIKGIPTIISNIKKSTDGNNNDLRQQRNILENYSKTKKTINDLGNRFGELELAITALADGKEYETGKQRLLTQLQVEKSHILIVANQYESTRVTLENRFKTTVQQVADSNMATIGKTPTLQAGEETRTQLQADTSQKLNNQIGGIIIEIGKHSEIIENLLKQIATAKQNGDSNTTIEYKRLDFNSAMNRGGLPYNNLNNRETAIYKFSSLLSAGDKKNLLQRIEEQRSTTSKDRAAYRLRFEGIIETGKDIGQEAAIAQVSPKSGQALPQTATSTTVATVANTPTSTDSQNIDQETNRLTEISNSIKTIRLKLTEANTVFTTYKDVRSWESHKQLSKTLEQIMGYGNEIASAKSSLATLLTELPESELKQEASAELINIDTAEKACQKVAADIGKALQAITTLSPEQAAGLGSGALRQKSPTPSWLKDMEKGQGPFRTPTLPGARDYMFPNDGAICYSPKTVQVVKI